MLTHSEHGTFDSCRWVLDGILLPEAKMTENNTQHDYSTSTGNIEMHLSEALTECRHVNAFKRELGSSSAMINVPEQAATISLYYVDDSAIITVSYDAGACISDTAFSAGLSDAYSALDRIVRHVDCEVVHDDFDVLEGGSV